MSSASTTVPPTLPTTTGRPFDPPLPTAGNCPEGGDHVGIPVQGKNYNVCLKCGNQC